ncbi:hypothetical protein M758_4G072600 [Ceratodon purpureus]|nr:hypothetical protein M758_4G072600 [Ceratodon purpureus]
MSTNREENLEQVPIIYNRRRYALDSRGRSVQGRYSPSHTYKEQIIYKYVQHATGFWWVQTKYFYRRKVDDFHVWIIMEQEGESILFPVPLNFITRIRNRDDQTLRPPQTSSEIRTSLYINFRRHLHFNLNREEGHEEVIHL